MKYAIICKSGHILHVRMSPFEAEIHAYLDNYITDTVYIAMYLYVTTQLYLNYLK